LISNLVINWGAGRVAVGFEVKVVTDYGFDSEWICEVLKEVVYDHPLVLRVPSATVRLESFEDSGMEFFLRAFIGARKVREQWAIASKIRIEILKVFKNKGITIPYPNTVVHFADKEHTPVLDDKSSSISIKFNKQPE
jgi:small-conductance mechanosensitive channel